MPVSTDQTENKNGLASDTASPLKVKTFCHPGELQVVEECFMLKGSWSTTSIGTLLRFIFLANLSVKYEDQDQIYPKRGKKG